MSGSTSRTPGLAILVNGDAVGGVIDAEVTTTSYLAAARFRFRAALTASNPGIWTADKLLVEILLSVDGGSLSAITGNADRLSIDPIRGIVTVEGRDLAALFLAARTQETFENQTASEIIVAIAARHGLAAVVTSTTGLVERFFQNNHSRTTLDLHSRATTEWDLMAKLADLENYDLWVDGRSVFFAVRDETKQPIYITPADCQAIELERALDLAGGLQITVRSWDCLGQAALSQSASSAATGDDASTYVIVRPNLSVAAAGRLAQSALSQASPQERTLCIEMPGELSFAPRLALVLGATGTDFDGNYVVSEVDRRFSLRHGFTQSVRARMPLWMPS